MSDARFRDGDAAPLRLWATDADDLRVVSALCQDAVLPASEMRWQGRARRFAMLLNRVRREDRGAAPERVQCVLTAGDVRRVRAQGLAPGDGDTILSLLSLDWEPGDDGAGILRLIFAGDGEMEVLCECLDVTLRDVTRPHRAVAGRLPYHGG